MVGNNNLIKLFDKAVTFSKGTRIQKLRRAPLKLFHSKISEHVVLRLASPITIKARTFWSENMFVVLPEIVSLEISRYGFFEEGLTRMTLEHLKSGMTFFDIGSHYGYFTLLASKIVGGNGSVHSFEPAPNTFRLLVENSRFAENVRVNNMAVFSRSMKITLNDYGVEYSALNSLYNARLGTNGIQKLNLKSYEVQSISIDEYVERTGVIPNFIKIDAESSEFEILGGMTRTIHDFHPIISIEVGDYGVEGIPRSNELVLYLMNQGYDSYEYDVKKERIVEHELKEKYEYDNILFIPKR